MNPTMKKSSPLIRNPDVHQSFAEMSKERFEHFAAAMHEAQGEIRFANLYAPDGQKQFGVDHLAYRKDGKIEAGQAKRYKRVTEGNVRSWANDFLKHWETHWKSKNIVMFRFFFACAVKNRKANDELIAQQKEFAKMGIELEWWDANDIFRKLPEAKQAVRLYLGQEDYNRIFGPPTGPFASLAAQMDSGSPNAFALSAIGKAFHDGSSQQLESFQLLVKRGKRTEAKAQLESKLRQPDVVDALVSEDRAAHWRLLASLEISAGEYSKAKAHLDAADAANTQAGTSERLRMVLAMESESPEAALARHKVGEDPELADVEAVAHLRMGHPDLALAALEAHEPSAERQAEFERLSSFSLLLMNRRKEALTKALAATEIEPESRACRYMAAVCHFHMALSDIVPPMAESWPQPLELPLVKTIDTAEEALAIAGSVFAELAKEPADSPDADMHCWQLAAHCLTSGKREAAQTIVDELAQSGKLTTGVIAWSMASALSIDKVEAMHQLKQVIERRPDDLTAKLVLIALLHNRKMANEAKTVFESCREGLLDAGAHDSVAYWDTLFGIHQNPDGSKQTEQSTAARFRLIVAKRFNKRSLENLTALLGDLIAEDKEAALILASTQILHEHGMDRQASIACVYLVDTIATGEAIGLAATVLARAGMTKEALKALSNKKAFRGGQLPIGLIRLEADCLALSGDIVLANMRSIELAGATLDPNDVLRAIRTSITVGDIGAAQDLHLQHQDLLQAASREQLLLAKALSRSDPTYAANITRKIADDVPSELVPAMFELAHKLGVADKTDGVLKQLMACAGNGGSVVHFDDLDEVLAWMAERKRQAEEVNEDYALGKIPIHAVAAIEQAPLVRRGLNSLFDDTPIKRKQPVFTRYGRRYFEFDAVEKLSEFTIAADPSALLSAEALGILDKVVDAADSFFVSPDTVPALLDMAERMQTISSSRIAAAREVLRSISDGLVAIHSHGGELLPIEVNADDHEDDISFEAFASSLLSDVCDHESVAAMKQLGLNELRASLENKAPGYSCQFWIAVNLAEAGIWQAAAQKFNLNVHASDVSDLEDALSREIAESKSAELIDRLIPKVRRGLQSRKWKTTSRNRQEAVTLEHACLTDVLHASTEKSAISWVDDRFTTSIVHPQMRVCSTIEITEMLAAEGHLEASEEREIRQRLRHSGWLFVPFNGQDLVAPMQGATELDRLAEGSALADIRRTAAFQLSHRQRIQWPNPKQVEAGIHGELPYILDLGHATSAALVAIWRDQSFDDDAACARSDWIIEQFDFSLFPMAILGPDDPRSDYTLGTTLAALMLVALQILCKSETEARQMAYCHWFWTAVMRDIIRIRPKALSHTLDFMAHHFVHTLLDGDAPEVEESAWRGFVSRGFNALPDLLRSELLEREEVREAFGIPNTPELTVGGTRFNEHIFWDAVLTCSTDELLIDDAEGMTWRMHHETTEHGEAIVLTDGERGLRLPTVQREIGSSDLETRNAGLGRLVREYDVPLETITELKIQLEESTSHHAITEAMRASACTMHSWYSQLTIQLEREEGLTFDALLPDRWRPVVERMRMQDPDADLESAVESLLDELGEAETFLRLTALPCNLPRALKDVLLNMDGTAFVAFQSELKQRELMPWTHLRLAEILCERGEASDSIAILQGAIDWALSEEVASVWKLRLGLARFLLSDGSIVPDWAELTDRQQLAAVWLHSHELASKLMERGPPTSLFLDQLLAKNGGSPRHLFEEAGSPMARDSADPRNLDLPRLLAVETGSLLSHLSEIVDAREWAISRLTDTRFIQTPEGAVPNALIARNAFASKDVLGSFFSSQLDEKLDALQDGCGITCAEGAEALHLALLETVNPSDHPAIEMSIRFIAGSAAMQVLPEAMASKLRELLRDYCPSAWNDADIIEDGLRDKLSNLLSLTCLASVNGWTELGEKIDCAFVEAIEALKASTIEELSLLLDVAFWRARMEEGDAEKLIKLASQFEQLALIEYLVEPVIHLTRDFARKLCGEQSAPFIDVACRLSMR